MFENPNENKKVLKSYLRPSWFAPQDAFLRAFDAIIWNSQNFSYPVLDIGCGEAYNSGLLYKGKKKIDIGLDINKEAVSAARETGFFKKVVCADVAKMPFKDGVFNTVVSNSTFEHVKMDVKGVGEVSRVLKRGGRFLFTVPTRRLEKIASKYFKSKIKLAKFNNRVQHLHYRSIDGWTMILRKNGFMLIKHKTYFSESALLAWLKLFGISTFKPYKRELWSYLRDSPYGKIIPKGLVSFLMYAYLERFFEESNESRGCWALIEAKKVK